MFRNMIESGHIIEIFAFPDDMHFPTGIEQKNWGAIADKLHPLGHVVSANRMNDQLVTG